MRTQTRMFAAAGLLLLAAGFLWGAFRHEKPERLPPGWEPVNDRLDLSVSEVAAGVGADAPASAGEVVSHGEQSGAGGGQSGGGADEAAAPNGRDAAGGEGAATDRPDSAGGEGAATDRPDSAGGEGAAPDRSDADGEVGAPSGTAGFDINRATAEEWDELPGIGPAKARAIVDDRERNGPFRSIDDLARVKGIGPKLLDRLREAIEARNASGG